MLAAGGVAFGAYMSVDCRQRHSGALHIGALVSLPFFVVAWAVLAFDTAGVSRWTVRVVLVLCAFQAALAFLITATATFGGTCPCRSELWSGTAGPPSLKAVGMDRLVVPLLVMCAGITAALAVRGRRRAV